MNVDTPTYISLFAGCGGLDLAVRLAIPGARCVLYVEREASAARILAARMADGSIEPAPIWSDVRTVDGLQLRGRVDGIVGGSPCQDLSVAGKREGIGGKRSGLFWEFLRIIEEAQPSFVLWENVEGAKSSLTIHHRGEIVRHLDELQLAAEMAPTPRGRWHIERHRERLHGRLLREHGIAALLYVCCCLERLGYTVEPGELAASDVGAPHRRKRVFVVAYRRCEYEHLQQRAAGDELTGGERQLAHSPLGGLGVRRESSGGGGLADGGDEGVANAKHTGPSRPRAAVGSSAAADDACGSGASALADARYRLLPQPGRGPQGRDGAGSAGEDGVADAQRNGGAARLSGSQPRQEGQSGVADDCRLPLFPPGPADRAGWAAILQQWPWLAPAVESGVRGLVDGMAVVVDTSRADSLRAVGNGVVSVQGAAAFIILARRAGLNFWGRDE